MKTRLFVLTAAGISAVTAVASAAPPIPGREPPGGGATVREVIPMERRVAVPAILAGRLNRQLTKDIKKDGRKATPKDIFDSFDKNATVKLPDGRVITVQQLVDKVASLEDGVKKKGGSLAGLKRSAFLSAGTLGKMQAVDKRQAVILDSIQKQNTGVPPVVNKCTVMACEPSLKEKSIVWGDTWGDEDTLAAYTKLTVTSKHPNAHTASCKLDWDNGIYLLGDKKELVRFVAEGNVESDGTPSAAGKAILYVKGQSVWEGSGDVKDKDLSRSFNISKSLRYPLVPGISVKGTIEAQATLKLKPTYDRDAATGNVSCKISVTPTLETKVTGKAGIDIDIGGVDIAEGGIAGEVEPVDLKLPTELGIVSQESPQKVNLVFKSNLNATMMKGRVYAYYKISDVCAFGYCLIEDGLGIDTSGEYDLWKHNGYRFDKTLVNLSQDLPFKPVATGGNMAATVR
jgi:hypothetical protein